MQLKTRVATNCSLTCSWWCSFCCNHNPTQLHFEHAIIASPSKSKLLSLWYRVCNLALVGIRLRNCVYSTKHMCESTIYWLQTRKCVSEQPGAASHDTRCNASYKKPKWIYLWDHRCSTLRWARLNKINKSSYIIAHEKGKKSNKKGTNPHPCILHEKQKCNSIPFHLKLTSTMNTTTQNLQLNYVWSKCCYISSAVQRTMLVENKR
jgi:hypothetical protein